MNWDDAELATEPEYTCDSINEAQNLVRTLELDTAVEKDLVEMLEDLRTLNMQLRAYARTGWSRAENSTYRREYGEGTYLDDLEDEIEQEGIFA